MINLLRLSLLSFFILHALLVQADTKTLLFYTPSGIPVYKRESINVQGQLTHLNVGDDLISAPGYLAKAPKQYPDNPEEFAQFIWFRGGKSPRYSIVFIGPNGEIFTNSAKALSTEKLYRSGHYFIHYDGHWLSALNIIAGGVTTYYLPNLTEPPKLYENDSLIVTIARLNFSAAAVINLHSKPHLWNFFYQMENLNNLKKFMAPSGFDVFIKNIPDHTLAFMAIPIESKNASTKTIDELAPADLLSLILKILNERGFVAEANRAQKLFEHQDPNHWLTELTLRHIHEHLVERRSMKDLRFILGMSSCDILKK